MDIYVTISGLYRGAGPLAFNCLRAQTDQNFRVIILDWGHDPELLDEAARFSRDTDVPILRVPYRPAPGGRTFDWAGWNSACLLAESLDDLIFRFQSWRLIPANLIAELRRANSSVGFVRAPKTFLGFWEVYEFLGGEAPVWPNKDETSYGLYGCYGDWALKVADLLTLNGIDEPFSMISHAEDLDFECRWRNAVRRHLVLPAQGWCGAMLYVTPETRELLAPGAVAGKAEAERVFQHPCPRCQRKWPELQATNDPDIAWGQLSNREGMIDLGKQFGKRWFFCTRCQTPICHSGTPDFTVLNADCYSTGEFRAPVGIAGRWGRYLRKARQKALALPLAERLDYVGASYTDPEVLRL